MRSFSHFARGPWSAVPMMLLAMPTLARAQQCGGIGAPESSFAVQGSVGAARYDFPDRTLTGRDYGAALTVNPTGPLSLAADFTYRDLERTGANPAIIRGTALYALPRLPFVGRPCIHGGIGYSYLKDDASSTRYTSVGVPLGLFFGTRFEVGSVRITPYVAPHALFVTTGSRAFGFDLSASQIGYGAEAGMHIFFNRLALAAIFRLNNLGRALGPQPYPPRELTIRLGIVP